MDKDAVPDALLLVARAPAAWPGNGGTKGMVVNPALLPSEDEVFFVVALLPDVPKSPDNARGDEDGNGGGPATCEVGVVVERNAAHVENDGSTWGFWPCCSKDMHAWV